MPPKIVLKLKTSVSYNLLKSECLKLAPDLKVVGGDGSVQHIHKDLLKCVSSKFYRALEYSEKKGHDLECLGSIRVPVLDDVGLKCLNDLLYKGSHLIDASEADDIINRLNNLDLPLTNHELNGSFEDQGDDPASDAHIDDPDNVHSDTYSPEPPSSTGSTSVKSSWSNRLRIRKRKIFNSSSADEDEKPTPTPTPSSPETTPTRTSSLTKTPNSTKTINPTKISNPSKPPTNSRTTSDAISQEDRDIQQITTVIKSFLPHPACFLVEDGNLECFVCGEIFRYRDNWRRHLLEQHFHLTFLCPTCGQKFKRRGKCSEHMSRCSQGVADPPHNNHHAREPNRSKTKS